MPKARLRPLGPEPCSRPVQTTEIQDLFTQVRELQTQHNESNTATNAVLLALLKMATSKDELLGMLEGFIKVHVKRVDELAETVAETLRVLGKLLKSAQKIVTGFITVLLIIIVLYLQRKR